MRNQHTLSNPVFITIMSSCRQQKTFLISISVYDRVAVLLQACDAIVRLQHQKSMTAPFQPMLGFSMSKNCAQSRLARQRAGPSPKVEHVKAGGAEQRMSRQVVEVSTRDSRVSARSSAVPGP